MKRHNFGGLRQLMVFQYLIDHGSTGQRQDPGKCLKEENGWSHGNKFRTMQNLEIIKADVENDLLYLKVQYRFKKYKILVKKSVKNIKKLTIEERSKLLKKQKNPDKRKNNEIR